MDTENNEVECGRSFRGVAMSRRAAVAGLGIALLAPFAAALTGCSDAGANGAGSAGSKDAPAQETTVRVSALKGPTAMGMVKLMSDADEGVIKEPDYEFDLIASPDELAPLVAQGKVDIAACPANLASVLYNNTDGGVTVLAINTLGVLYLCEIGESISSVADLAGKTIVASGKGATPEYALRYILEHNGINPDTDVTIEWKSEHAECVAAMADGSAAVALLPQPFVTTAQMKNDAIRVALDLTKEWEALQDGLAQGEPKSSLITGVVIARKEFVSEHPEAVQAFMKNYKASVAYVTKHVDEASELVGSYDIVPAPVAKRAIPACSIVYIDGADMEKQLGGYLSVLFNQNPKAVGGSLPKDDFYYQA